MNNANRNTRVVVAMSGGVDSSVAAALLVERGYDVVGMMMRLWSDDAMGGPEHNRCCTPEQMADARRIANALNIPFYVLDVKDVFRATIVDFFIDSYRDGVTPNPCIECNRKIRFDYLLKNALAFDADYLTTGHHARVVKADSGYQLLKGVDGGKDQSYVLSVLGQEQLAHTMLPIGDFQKLEVRELAARYGLNVESKKDSQDLCFLGNRDYRQFLDLYAPDIMQPGPIVLTDGTEIGEHEGLSRYTIGQRRGLGLSYHQTLYVIAKNPYRNALIVGFDDERGTASLIAKRINWIEGALPSESFHADVKIRYTSPPVPATVIPVDSASVRIVFDEAQRDVAPGQGAVMYDSERCLGGGIIAKEDDFKETEIVSSVEAVEGQAGITVGETRLLR